MELQSSVIGIRDTMDFESFGVMRNEKDVSSAARRRLEHKKTYICRVAGVFILPL